MSHEQDQEPTQDDIEETQEHEGADEGSDDQFDVERAKAKINKSNREAAGLRKRLKDMESELSEYREWKESQKSDHDKALERAEAAEKKAVELEAQIVRAEVAAAKGLTAAQAQRLTGATKEELEQDADELLAMFAPSPKTPPPPQKLRGGSNPVSSDLDELDPSKLADRVRRRLRTL